MKDFYKVLLEGVFTAICFVFLYTIYLIISKLLLKYVFKYTSYKPMTLYISLMFISVILLHIIFEYTGLNKYYVDNYSK
jgi:hypothetical protein